MYCVGGHTPLSVPPSNTPGQPERLPRRIHCAVFGGGGASEALGVGDGEGEGEGEGATSAGCRAPHA